MVLYPSQLVPPRHPAGKGPLSPSCPSGGLHSAPAVIGEKEGASPECYAMRHFRPQGDGLSAGHQPPSASCLRTCISPHTQRPQLNSWSPRQPHQSRPLNQRVPPEQAAAGGHPGAHPDVPHSLSGSLRPQRALSAETASPALSHFPADLLSLPNRSRGRKVCFLGWFRASDSKERSRLALLWASHLRQPRPVVQCILMVSAIAQMPLWSPPIWQVSFSLSSRGQLTRSLTC